MPTDSTHDWRHPWLRVSLLVRMMLQTRWDAETRPQVNRHAIFLAVLLFTPLPASAESYRMLVNHGAGWSTAGDFGTLEECKREAALYAAKHSAQAGCAAVSALERQRLELERQRLELERQLERQRLEQTFQQTAARCAASADVKIIHKPGTKIEILGTTEARFAFNQCMAESGQATESR